MDNNQEDDFVYPSTAQPMQPPVTPKFTPKKQEPLTAPATVQKTPASDDFVYPTELKSMQEATAAPTQVKPYAELPGKIKSTFGRGVPFAGANILMTVPDIVKTGLEYSRYNPMFPSYYGMQPEAAGVKPSSVIPGSEEAKKLIEPYVYEPKTKEEAKVASAAETGLTAALGIGKLKAVPTLARLVTGYGSQSLANELVDLFPQAAIIPAVAMMGGEGFASAVKGMRDADRIMANKIKQAYELDVRNGKIDPTTLDPNTPILEAAPPGSALRKLVTTESKIATSFPQQLEDFNQRVQNPRKLEMLTEEMGNLLQRTTNRPMGQSAELRDLVKTVDGKDVDRVYEIARNYPPAAAIDPAIFQGVENLPIVKGVEQTVQNNILNISNPTKRAQYEIPDPTTGKKGNLAYWDAVYRQLRQDGRSLSRDPATAAAAENSSSAAQYLRDALDNYTTIGSTSLYGNARNKAHEHFGSVNSLEMGNDFYVKTPASAIDLQDDMAKFSLLSPEQRTLARYGYVDSLYKDIASRGFTRIADNLADETTPFAQKTKVALAKPEIDAQGNPTGRLDYTDYDIVRGKILKSAIEENLQPVKTQESVSPPGFFERNPNKGIAIAAGIGTAIGATSNALQDFAFAKGFMSPEGIATLAATTAVAGGIKMGISARNNAMKRAANEVLLRLSTGNVRDLQALSQLTRENPFAAAFYKQLQAGLRASQVSGVSEGQAAGGRVGRADGGRISVEQGVRALMRAVEDAKKSVTKSTENLLQLPDEHVAQTLDAAKRHI